MIKSIFYLAFLAIAACGVKHSSIDYGKTTKADLIAAKGEPIEEKPISLKDSTMLIYPENEKYQLKNDVVEYGLKDPKGDQLSLIYWKHKFKDCKTTVRKLEVKGHVQPELQLTCAEEGTTIVYSEGSDYVSRIIEHEKK